MGDAYIGEIRMFAGTFAPMGWALCDGSLYPIASYPDLYSLIGTTYGGDGVNTFAVPDLRGRVPIHRGTGSGLSPRTIGQSDGAETVTLASTNVPTHSHTLTATQNPASSSQPGGNLLAKPASILPLYTPIGPVAALDSAAIGASGGPAQAHNNMQPYLCVNFIICMDGISPTRG